MEPLKPFEIAMNPDGRWDMFQVPFPLLYQLTADMNLDENVPERVRVQFQQAQHVLLYSYLQFSLVTVAFTQACIALECALRTRLKAERQLSGTPQAEKSEPGLKRLLSAAVEKGWLTNVNPALVKYLPDLRNELTHGEYMLSPLDSLDMVRSCGRFIQQLFPAAAP